MSKSYIIIGILVIALVFVYFHKPSGHDQQMQRLMIENQRLRLGMDSAKARAEEFRKAALEYGNQFRAEATRAQKAEERFNYLREENNILRRRVIRYSDKSLDSLFQSKYGQY